MPDIFAMNKYFGNTPQLDFFEEQHDRAGHMYSLDMCEDESCREAARRSSAVLRRKENMWYCNMAVVKHDPKGPLTGHTQSSTSTENPSASSRRNRGMSEDALSLVL